MHSLFRRSEWQELRSGPIVAYWYVRGAWHCREYFREVLRERGLRAMIAAMFG